MSDDKKDLASPTSDFISEIRRTVRAILFDEKDHLPTAIFVIFIAVAANAATYKY